MSFSTTQRDLESELWSSYLFRLRNNTSRGIAFLISSSSFQTKTVTRIELFLPQNLLGSSILLESQFSKDKRDPKSMMKREKEDRREMARRTPLDRLCCMSGLLLSIACCVALIHVFIYMRKYNTHQKYDRRTVTFKLEHGKCIKYLGQLHLI